jgi:putative nucleotidyltransferase with HDIG domain
MPNILKKEKPDILVIDDEKTIRELLKSFLKKNGYRVATVSSGKAAIKAIEESSYDIALLDIKLQGSNGMKLLRDIKRRDPFIEIIVITGFATVESVVDALQSGAYDYVSKPFRLDELKIVIDRCFEKQKLAGENIELKELVALFAVSRKISARVELNELLDQVLMSALQITGARRGSILIIDEDRKVMSIKASRGLNDGIVRDTKVKLGEGIAGTVALKGEPLLISDIEKESRFEGRKTANYETKSFLSVPLISLPLKVHGRVMGVINLSDKIDRTEFNDRDLRLISVLAGQAAVAVENARLFNLLRDSYMGTVRALVRALEAKDKVTRDHSERVAMFAAAIAEQMGLSRHEVEGIRMAAFLHDIGKLGIDLEVLAKPGKLTSEEWKLVRKHPEASADIIEGISFIWDIIPLVKYHHERFDGKGFPRGLKGKDIPVGARILSVADAFEAMTAKRPYKNAIPAQKALKELKSLVGERYDKDVVKAFESVLKSEKAH